MTGNQLPRSADAAHITEALRRSNLPGDMRVREVVVESSRATILSRIIRLRLIYDRPAADVPTSLILKTGLPERIRSGWKAGQQEVAFYSNVAAATEQRLVPRCYDAHWDAATDDWHLLLEDLTDTHATPTVWPLPPTTKQCEAIVETLARFHAAWWDDPRLGSSIGTWRDAAANERLLHDLTTHFTRFAERLGDALPRERRMLYQRFLAAFPRLLERYNTHRNVTLVHGDAHVWNIFLPRDGGDSPRIFDWDGWRIGIAASDLAYMMALHWYPDRRQRLERTLLDRYHADADRTWRARL